MYCTLHTRIQCVLMLCPVLPVQMYVNALIKRAGIFAGQQNVDKCKTCLEKARVLSPHSVDILVHSARVSCIVLLLLFLPP